MAISTSRVTRLARAACFAAVFALAGGGVVAQASPDNDTQNEGAKNEVEAPDQAEDAKPAPKLIDVDFINADIHSALMIISAQSGLSVNVDANVRMRVTVLFRNVEPRDAIKHICRAYGLTMVEDGAVIIIRLGEEAEPAAKELRPLEPITVDFLRKDVHIVMHYVAMRSGLNIEVDRAVNVTVTVLFRDIDPIELVRIICNAHNLELEVDGHILKIREAKADPEGEAEDDAKDDPKDDAENDAEEAKQD